ncbi:NAD(P)-dependent oxidoreductase [Cryptosporangium japonicum]|uniref:NAD(P)-dependent oxidoreductase n=1 Tax=Cryptosporangium japonicum TaxID=80872 RepID=A0ABN0UFZ5_9ACTN
MTGPVGFVGLGTIGKPMAQRLLAWPGGLVVYDVAPEPPAELERAGAKVAGSVTELVGQVGLVGVMVRNDQQVRQVLAEMLPAAQPGLIVAIHSTVAPDTPAELAAVAAEHGIRVIDAPVSGGGMGAADGSLAILVGGDEETFAAAEGPLRLMGRRVVHAGPIGAGTRFKLARNLLHFVAFAAAGEAARLAEAAGLDLIALGKVVRHTDAITGGPGAVLIRDTTAPVAADYPFRGSLEHAWTLGEKDLGFAVELADRLGVDVPLARRALRELGPALGFPSEGQA